MVAGDTRQEKVRPKYMRTSLGSSIRPALFDGTSQMDHEAQGTPREVRRTRNEDLEGGKDRKGNLEKEPRI